MEQHDYYPDDCIAALATPWGESALAVIRTSGEESIEKIAHCFSRRQALLEAKAYTAVFGKIIDPDTGDPLDEVLATVFRSPRSYTGQDGVELSIHGNMAGAAKILELLFNRGFRQAARGEFTLRAFLNGKVDLTRAEAVREIIASKSGKAHSLALHRLSGGIESRINAAKAALADIKTRIELQLDYSDEEPEAADEAVPLTRVEQLKSTLSALAETYRVGKVYQEGVLVVLAGPTNAGKSSLFNLFVREDRSIVSEIHGTTRDYIESWLTVEGIPVKLYDTAGIRISRNPIEAAGIERSEKLIDQADIILYVVDGTVGLSDDDRRFVTDPSVEDRIVIIMNKSDLSPHVPTTDMMNNSGSGSIPAVTVEVSAVTGEGFKSIEQEIVRRSLEGDTVTRETPVIDSLRQKQLIDRCIEALDNTIGGIEENAPLDMIATDVQEALHSLGEITGEVTTTDILNKMFSQFCVGK